VRAGTHVAKRTATLHVPLTCQVVQMRRLDRQGRRRSATKTLRSSAMSVAVFVAWYNFWRVHQTLRVTPAREAGIPDHVWICWKCRP
jgi:hypothetical protein